MAAQAGICYRDSRPAEDATIDVLSRVNDHLGPDGRGLYTTDGLVMLSFALHFDTLSTCERQPVRNVDGSILTWDGRLDNRDDFIGRSGVKGQTLLTDAQLIAQALSVRGYSALREAVGDWGLAMWNATHRELLLARDYAGNRPLYYCSDPDFFAWSTSIEPLAALCNDQNDLDEAYLAGWLMFDPPGSRTWHRRVRSVAAGGALRLRQRDLRVCQTLVSQATPGAIRYKTTAQYEEHYRSLFTDAVRVRLRAKRQVWCELSGGYDSSAVTCVASALIAAHAVDAPTLQPISVTTPESLESDESSYIASVEEHCGVVGVKGAFRRHIDVDQASYALPPLRGHHYVPSPARVAADAGAHVMMSGQFGDIITGPASAHDVFLELLLAAHWRTFARECIRHCRARRDSIGEVLRTLPSVYKEWRGRTDHDSLAIPTAFAAARRISPRNIAEAFGLRQDFVSRAYLPTTPGTLFHTPLPRVAEIVLHGVRTYVALDTISGGRPSHALRITYPFMHRPLVEFVAALPAEAMWSATHPRAFVLSALQGALPEAVIRRGFKGHPVAAMSRDLRPFVRSALAEMDQWLLVTRGYADLKAMSELFARFLDGSQLTGPLVARLFGAETMLQRISHQSGARRTKTGTVQVPTLTPITTPALSRPA
jgi:asparagine synthetase B (glutamine-hydrolysing)